MKKLAWIILLAAGWSAAGWTFGEPDCGLDLTQWQDAVLVLSQPEISEQGRSVTFPDSITGRALYQALILQQGFAFSLREDWADPGVFYQYLKDWKWVSNRLSLPRVDTPPRYRISVQLSDLDQRFTLETNTYEITFTNENKPSTYTEIREEAVVRIYAEISLEILEYQTAEILYHSSYPVFVSSSKTALLEKIKKDESLVSFMFRNSLGKKTGLKPEEVSGLKLSIMHNLEQELVLLFQKFLSSSDSPLANQTRVLGSHHRFQVINKGFPYYEPGMEIADADQSTVLRIVSACPGYSLARNVWGQPQPGMIIAKNYSQPIYRGEISWFFHYFPRWFPDTTETGWGLRAGMGRQSFWGFWELYLGLGSRNTVFMGLDSGLSFNIGRLGVQAGPDMGFAFTDSAGVLPYIGPAVRLRWHFNPRSYLAAGFSYAWSPWQPDEGAGFDFSHFGIDLSIVWRFGR